MFLKKSGNVATVNNLYLNGRTFTGEVPVSLSQTDLLDLPQGDNTLCFGRLVE